MSSISIPAPMMRASRRTIALSRRSGRSAILSSRVASISRISTRANRHRPHGGILPHSARLPVDRPRRGHRSSGGPAVRPGQTLSLSESGAGSEPSRNIPAAVPSRLKTNRTPAASIAFRMASRLLAIGVRRAVSKSRTVLRETLARSARSVCDQPNHPRAARLCSGDIKRSQLKLLI